MKLCLIYEFHFESFLLFIKYLFDVNTSVILIYRGHDAYTVGHLRNGIAYLLKQRDIMLERTEKCLRAYGIRHHEMLSDNWQLKSQDPGF